MCQSARLYSEWPDHSQPKKRNIHNKDTKPEVPKQHKTLLKKKRKTPMLFANAKTSGALQRSAPCRKACHGCERCGVVDNERGIL